jgi:hypothetical protein
LDKIYYFLKKKKLLCKVPIFFIHRLGSGEIYQKKKKKVGVVIYKIGDDVIGQKAMTSFKVGRHMMAFFEVKSTCPSDLPKYIMLL